jgi:DNA-binding NarL/FixJ family response regulator
VARVAGEKIDRDRTASRVVLNVLIADDHPLILFGIQRVLETSDDIGVVGEARSGEELLRLVGSRRPDVVLMDLHLPGLDGLACITEIGQSWPKTKIVVLSESEDPVSINSALQAGAHAYVLRSLNPAEIPALLRQVSGGAVYHAPVPYAVPLEEHSVSLTEREMTVLMAVASGLTTRAISRELWVSEHTVKFHLTNVYRKLGVPNRACAVRYAIERKLIASTS